MSATESVTCECGRPADAPYEVWNGKHYMPVCEGCWQSPECMATEACVTYAEDATGRTLEDLVRLEAELRGLEWTHELQAFVDKCYLEWYLEE